MLVSRAADILKHILSQEDWTHRRLKQYQGKTVRIYIPPIFELKLTVSENGELNLAEKDIEANTQLTVFPALLPGMLLQDESVYARIDISGDKTFATELISIGKHLKPHFEHQLSKLFGDIPAHRINQAGKNLFQWHIDLFRNLSDSFGEYWLEERQLITKSYVISNTAEYIKILQHDVNRLETRINRISKNEYFNTAF